MTNEELKTIYFGAYSFKDREDGYLQAFQYTEPQMEYFKSAFEMWYERCDASTAKTIEMTTDATKVSFDYKLVWHCSQDSFEIAVNGLIHDIRYLKDIPEEGTISFDLPEGKKNVIIYLPADTTAVIKNFEINGSFTPREKGQESPLARRLDNTGLRPFALLTDLCQRRQPHPELRHPKPGHRRLHLRQEVPHEDAGLHTGHDNRRPRHQPVRRRDHDRCRRIL